MGRRHRLRLGRFALPQPDRKDDQHRGRQELALPVLEALEPELGIAEIGKVAGRRVAMLERLFGRRVSAVPPVKAEGQQEEREQRQAERMGVDPASGGALALFALARNRPVPALPALVPAPLAEQRGRGRGGGEAAWRGGGRRPRLSRRPAALVRELPELAERVPVDRGADRAVDLAQAARIARIEGGGGAPS